MGDLISRKEAIKSIIDKISGFPYCWAKYNGPENCVWSSEIEEFCIAVAKAHFGDDDTGEKGNYFEMVRGDKQSKQFH